MRNLFIIIAIIAAFVIIKRLIKSGSRKKQQTLPKSGYAATVQCKQCGVHLPKSDAYENSGDYFCNEAHYLEHNQST